MTLTDEQIMRLADACGLYGVRRGALAFAREVLKDAAPVASDTAQAPHWYERHDPDNATAPFLSFIPDAKRDELIGALLASLEKSDQRETDFFMVRSFIGGLGLLAAQFAPKQPDERGLRFETMHEHIARDMREGRFPERSPVQMVAARPDERAAFPHIAELIEETERGLDTRKKRREAARAASPKASVNVTLGPIQKLKPRKFPTAKGDDE